MAGPQASVAGRQPRGWLSVGTGQHGGYLGAKLIVSL